jgi:hypothetical protein
MQHMYIYIHLTHILTQHIAFKLILLPAYSHIYMYMFTLFDLMTDIQLDNTYEQGIHILLECMAQQFRWLMFKCVYHLNMAQK